jgi:hypothetical protein
MYGMALSRYLCIRRVYTLSILFLINLIEAFARIKISYFAYGVRMKFLLDVSGKQSPASLYGNGVFSTNHI